MGKKNLLRILGLGSAANVVRTVINTRNFEGNTISYVVHNLTRRTIVLSDLRAEIGPHKMLDLEKVADTSTIQRSHDLKFALNTSRLRLCSHGIVSKNKPEIQVIERIVEKQGNGFDEDRLKEILRQIVGEKQTVLDPSQPLLEALAALEKKIAAIGGKEDETDIPSLDPELLAELQSKAVAKISDTIETGLKKSGKKVILKDTGLGDLANELA